MFNMFNMTNGSETEKNSARIGSRVPQTLRDRLDELARKARLDVSDVVRIGLLTQMPAIEQVVLMQGAATDLGIDAIVDLVAVGQKARAHGVNLRELLEKELSRLIEKQEEAA